MRLLLPLLLAPSLAAHRAYIGSAFLNPDVVAGEAVAFEPGLPRHVVVGVTLTTR